MSGKRIIGTWIVLLIMAVLSLQGVAAEVVVFEAYDTTFSYADGRLTVNKELTLKNVGDSPIIPGEIHFKISGKDGDELYPLEVSDFAAEGKRGKVLDTRKVEADSSTELIFTIWDPLLPKFTYDMSLSYSVSFKPKGILFYNMMIPVERTTIPIKKAETTVELPKRFHVTHAPEAEVQGAGPKRSLTWDKVSEDLRLEYTPLPLPNMGVRMVNVFWVAIIIVFVTIFVIRVVTAGRE